MAKYIDAVPVIHYLQTAADVMRLYYGDHAVVADVLSVVIDGLNKCPTADVAPVVHAKLKEDGAEDGLFCSVCGEGLTKRMNYCFYCGAIIEKEVKENGKIC